MTDAPIQLDAVRILQHGEEVVSIRYDGRVFWRGREVETDADFRGAMLEAVQLMAANTRVVTP